MRRTGVLAGILLVVVLLGGCAKNKEVRSGVYMSSDPADFPFPTSGYTVYIVGESHGNHETKLVFRSYLNKLYKEAGLRDVILEEDQAYESDANVYVRGSSETLPDGLCLRADILGQIREFNAELPDHEKVTVHLVDVDSPFPIIYKHLTELHSQMGSMGESVPVPELSEIKYANSEKLFGLLNDLRSVSAGQPDILNELDTVQLSLEWYYLGNRMDTGMPTGSRTQYAPIWEDVITKNVQYVLSQLNGKPVLAFFGLFHGMKVDADPNPPVKGFKSWAQRLTEDHVAVYSLAMFGASGTSSWRGETFSSDEEFLNDFKLADGTTLLSLFDSHVDSSIVYTDLRTEDNSTITLSSELLNFPASRLFDGIIIFKKFTPMENTCPQ